MRALLVQLRRLYVLPIRVYQGTLSRITPATCRFRPTCSQYAVEAVTNRGVVVGSLYAAWRILRCNPFVEGGWDLPPPPPGEAPLREEPCGHADPCGPPEERD